MDNQYLSCFWYLLLTSCFLQKVPAVLINVTPKKDIRIGDHVTLHCTDKGDEKIEKCDWKFKGKTLADIKTCTLTFHSVKKANEGEYTCTTEHGSSTNTSIIFSSLLFDRTQKQIYYGKIGINIQIEFYFSSYTHISNVSLSRGDCITIPTNINCSNQTKDFQIPHDEVYEYYCNLEIQQLNSTDFQNYTIVVTNGDMTETFYFSLKETHNNVKKRDSDQLTAENLHIIVTALVTIVGIGLVLLCIKVHCKAVSDNRKQRSERRRGEKTSSVSVNKQRLDRQPSNTSTSTIHRDNNDRASGALHYISMEFNTNDTKRTCSIRGEDDKTAYVEIDFSARADPLPSSSEDDVDGLSEKEYINVETHTNI